MKYGEVCAGVGGLSRGLELAGMDAAFHAEIASFPRRVLRHHWPDTQLLSDLVAISGGRKMRAWMRRHFAGLLVLAAGTPCQDLSVAGKRAGIFGLRSSLYFRFVRLWKLLECPYILWENVAGALSSNQGGDFALVLSAIVGGTVPVPSDGWPSAGVVAGPTGVAAWRLLDAQYFGVPQRRLRVFVLGARAGGVDPAEVLLEPHGVRRDTPPRGETGEGTADGAGDRIGFQSSQSGVRSVETFATLDANYGSRRHNGVLAFDTTQVTSKANRSNPQPGDPCHPLAAQQHAPLIAYSLGSHASTDGGVSNASHDAGGPVGMGISEEVSNALRAGRVQAIVHAIPRRLTPLECERLMDWPDGWTDIPDEKGKPASDSARYKACGNGVVSAKAQWIGERLLALHTAMVEAQDASLAQEAA